MVTGRLVTGRLVTGRLVTGRFMGGPYTLAFYPIVNQAVPLKGQCHDIFCFWFFSYKPLIKALGSFRIFSKIRRDIASQGAPPVSTKPRIFEQL